MNYTAMLYVGLGIPAAFLLLVLGFAAPQWWRGMASRRWPSVDGQVLYSAVASAKLGRRRFVAPDVRYQYDVDGRSHDGSIVRFNYSWTDASAGAAVARYPVGDKVRVFYKSTSPEKSVLEVGIDFGDIGRALVLPAFVTAVFVAAMIYVVLRRR